MDKEGEKKISPVILKHWKKKFEKAIPILLKGGIKPEELIQIIQNEKNNNP